VLPPVAPSWPAATGAPPPYSPYIAGTIDDYSRQLGNYAQRPSNIGQAQRLWQASGLAEDLFVAHLHTAYTRTRAAQGKQGTGQIGNKMAYFFEGLRDLLDLESG